MGEQILFDNFPLTFLDGDKTNEIIEDINEKNYREQIKKITNNLKLLKIEISEKYSIRNALEEKLRLLQKEEQEKQQYIQYIIQYADSKNNIYTNEIINHQNNLEHIKKQIQNSNCKIKLLLEKEFKVRKKLQIEYMTLHDILNQRIQYIINDYLNHRKCACAIYGYQQENKQE
ncbi:conserved protein, unknown function [Hepatocystis sp. ex Piliocolobus tephrosceles]|nr:conserved protein, unknown function [Hepatocystis sp. ex Piliocolobus tephrosceles]